MKQTSNRILARTLPSVQRFETEDTVLSDRYTNEKKNIFVQGRVQDALDFKDS